MAVVRTLTSPQAPEKVLDSGALVLYFSAPRTATGEDVLEFHVHGGQAIVSSVLKAIGSTSYPQSPVRYAEPGEFTRRAFYNDRLDLTQVEAFGDTLSAVTEEQRRLSVQGTRSKLSDKYEEWRNMLLHARGELEALIDFSEDQHFDESPRELASNVAAQVRVLIDTLDVHLENAMRGELLRSGIAVSLIGTPNVGKSSILNQIVGRNAAIVSKEAGTTRDIVEVGIDLGGFYCRLGDTAGLRKALQERQVSDMFSDVVGEIEQEGIRRARAQAEQSDVVIVVFSILSSTNASEASVHLDPEVVATANNLAAQGIRLVIVINKIDLAESVPGRELPTHGFVTGTSPKVTWEERLLAAVRSAVPSVPTNSVFLISCTAAQTRVPLTDANGTSNSPSALTASDDPGHFRAFVNGLIGTFREMTAALQPEGEFKAACVTGAESPRGVPQLSQHDTSLWADSLGASARQRQLLETCRDELIRFLNLVAGARRSAAHRDTTSEEQGPVSGNLSPALSAGTGNRVTSEPRAPFISPSADAARNGHITDSSRAAVGNYTTPTHRYSSRTECTAGHTTSLHKAEAHVPSAQATNIEPPGDRPSPRASAAGREAAFVTRGPGPTPTHSNGPIQKLHLDYHDQVSSFQKSGRATKNALEGEGDIEEVAEDKGVSSVSEQGLRTPDPLVWDASSHAPRRGRDEYDGITDEASDETQRDEDEVDIVAAAEHLRAAAAALGKITGRGEGGDVEEVLGVVFEKFCVGK